MFFESHIVVVSGCSIDLPYKEFCKNISVMLFFLAGTGCFKFLIQHQESDAAESCIQRSWQKSSYEWHWEVHNKIKEWREGTANRQLMILE